MTKILIVDDEEMMLMVTKRILSANYEVICASSGKDALEMFEKEKPDMILSDLLMPEMDGFEMHKLLQEKYGKKIPIMYMTADDNAELEGKGFDLGAADFIRKPFRPDVLLKRVENILENLEKIKDLTEEATIDKLTGCLNKASSIKKLTELCAEKEGILLVIDLDSFKLVNDIYGHEMGDKVLISFSMLIKNSLCENDIIGRIGGDEFVAFLEDTQSETRVAEFALRINKELKLCAEGLMGADMKIPLGMSVGAVKVPAFGKDYEELFGMADKALYFVKQNGKHGYSFFKKQSDTVITQEQSEKELKRLSTILEERNSSDCAFWLGQEAFSNVYRFIVRFIQSYNIIAQKLLFTIVPVNSEVGGAELIGICEEFGKAVNHSLRKSDIMMQSAPNSFFLLLPELSDEHVMVVVERIMNHWKSTEFCEKVIIDYDVEYLSAENVEDERRNTVI